MSNRVPFNKNLMCHFFDETWHSPENRGTSSERQAIVESSSGDRSGEVFVGRCIRGNGISYLDLSGFITGTLTVEVDWIRDSSDVINPNSRVYTDYVSSQLFFSLPSNGPVTLTTEVNDTLKRITLLNDTSYHGLHIYENGTRIAYYPCEEGTGGTVYNTLSNSNHAEVVNQHNDFWFTDSMVSFGYSNHLGYNVPNNLISNSDLGYTIAGTLSTGRREVAGFDKVDGFADFFGTNLASRFTENDTVNNPGIQSSNGRPLMLIGETYTFSVYLRAETGQTQTIRLTINGGLPANSGGSPTGDFVTINDQWARYSTTFTMTLSDARCAVIGGFGSVPRASCIVFFASHPQLVLGSEPLPYESSGIIIGQTGQIGNVPASSFSFMQDALGNPLRNFGRVREKAFFVDNNCLLSNGVWLLRINYQPVLIENNDEDITASCTIVQNGSDWDITFPNATQIFNLRINSNNHYPCSEGSGTEIGGFDVNNNIITGTLVNVLNSDWDTQDLYAYNAIEGANFIGGVYIPSPTPSLQGLRKGRRYANVESTIMFNDSPLIRYLGIDPTQRYTKTQLQTIFDSNSRVFGNNRSDYLIDLLCYFDTSGNINDINAFIKN